MTEPHTADYDAPGPLTCPTCGEPDPGRLHTFQPSPVFIPDASREALVESRVTRQAEHPVRAGSVRMKALCSPPAACPIPPEEGNDS